MTNFWLKRQYAEVSTETDGLSKRGLVYLLAEFFTIPGSGTILFGLSTNGTKAEFQSYDLASSLHPVKATLIESPTVTKTPSPIVGRNLNRSEPDPHALDFWTTTTYTGGTKIGSELVGTGEKAGGGMSSGRIFVLKPNTDYLITLENTQNQDTLFHINLAWSENEPKSPALWETVP
jgi:hypothetical protein